MPGGRCGYVSKNLGLRVELSFTGAGCTSLRDNRAALLPPVDPISRLRRRLQFVGPMPVPEPPRVLQTLYRKGARQLAVFGTLKSSRAER
jgi:hypothetical protein